MPHETFRSRRGDKPPVGGSPLNPQFHIHKQLDDVPSRARRTVADLASRHGQRPCRREHCPVCNERAADVLQALGLVDYRLPAAP